MCLCHESLGNLYRLNFSLMQYHRYSLEDLENMIPFERDIYVAMLLQFLEEQKERQKQQG